MATAEWGRILPKSLLSEGASAVVNGPPKIMQCTVELDEALLEVPNMA
jgi:hypothetical protein